ncbi:protein containing KilA-N, DNA-binding domain protein [gut metagenome]|uniref:Protein containing KilA-N, DNA-binding domain protein n=1 Tax=gut metagenome TaxID=749906 RepID=J9FUV1_9ZZZZ
MENLPQTIGTKEVEARVVEHRGQKVILDRDVAELYQTETREINKAVKNNPKKFPNRHCFTIQLSGKQYVMENFHHMESLKKSIIEPRGFTVRGLYMLATILKSKIATQTNIVIIDSFTKLRELTRNIEAIHNEPDNAKQKGLIQRTGKLLSDLLVDDTDTTETDTTIELNLMAVKFKHTVKRTKKNKPDKLPVYYRNIRHIFSIFEIL